MNFLCLGDDFLYILKRDKFFVRVVITHLGRKSCGKYECKEHPLHLIKIKGVFLDEEDCEL
jgi:hypothetical protein